MNEDWLTYAKRVEAYTRKWTPSVRKALNAQLKRYVESYKRGQPDINIFASVELYGVLQRIHADVGNYYGRTTYREVGKEVRRRGNETARRGAFTKARNGQDLEIKRGALGYSIDWANKIIERLRLSGLNMAQRISETTRRKVLYILEQAQAENLTLDETVDKMLSEVEEFNRNRAETIARTEVGRAAGEGKMHGAKALGVELDKIWISARDHRTRINPKKDPRKGDHWVLNEQVKPFDEPFSNGVHRLNQPGDPSAPPAEVINCRCTVAFKVKKDPRGAAIPRTYFDKPTTGHIQGTEGIAIGAILTEATT